MKYDGIIFDLDGTLWDAVEEGHLVLLEYLKTQPDVTHLPTKEEYAGVMGLGMDDLAEKLFPYLSYERRMQVFNEDFKLECEYLAEHGAKLYPHMHETLKKLSETHTAVHCKQLRQRVYSGVFEGAQHGCSILRTMSAWAAQVSRRPTTSRWSWSTIT